MYTVYIDIILIENLLINFVILHITALVLRRQAKWYRLLLSSFTGCIYCISGIFINILLVSFLLKILLSMLMVVIAFRLRTIKNFFEEFLVFYVTTFAFAGVTLLLFNTQKKYYIFLLSVIGYLICMCILKLIRRQKQKSLLYRVYIKMDNREVFLTAFLDTGNLLRDPFTNRGAIIAESSVIKQIIPNDIYKCITQNKEEELADFSPFWASRFLVLPFYSIGETSGNLKGFRCDYAVVTSDDQDTYIIKNAIIAIYFSNLCNSDEYSALLPPDILYNRS